MSLNTAVPLFNGQQLRFPILQSGFVSLNEEGLTKPDMTAPTIRDDILLKEYRTKADKYFYSKAITELFHQWRSNPSLIREMDFREQVLIQAFKLFKTDKLTTWIRAQNEKPSLSNIHNVFLLETIKFAAGIEKRSLENVQWISLIDYSDRAQAVRVNMDDYFREDSKHCYVPMKMDRFIQSWVSQVNGFEDLLISLYVIFGDREQKIDVVINT